jgi:hypothetical protein
MPLRFALPPRVLHDNSHPAIAIFIHGSAQDPNTGALHLYNRVNALGRSELEDFDPIRSRNRVAVQCDDVEFVAWQG